VLNTFFNQVADAHSVIFQEIAYDGGFAVADLSLVVGGQGINLSLGVFSLAVNQGLVGRNPFAEGGVHSLLNYNLT
jgi:hypothetical protein